MDTKHPQLRTTEVLWALLLPTSGRMESLIQDEVARLRPSTFICQKSWGCLSFVLQRMKLLVRDQSRLSAKNTFLGLQYVPWWKRCFCIPLFHFLSLLSPCVTCVILWTGHVCIQKHSRFDPSSVAWLIFPYTYPTSLSPSPFISHC